MSDKGRQDEEGGGHVLNHSECSYLHGAALSILVAGASGDLAKKKTFPALLDLYRHDFLPKGVNICGFARSKMSDADLRKKLRPFLTKEEDPVVDEFLSRCIYRSGDYGSAEAMGKVADDLTKLEDETDGERANRVFYFAIPPEAFLPLAQSIKAAALSPTGWNRLILEKPFGHDYDSALQLSKDLGKQFDESYIYRIDHYLGKEMVQNLLVMRFSNCFFEPLWNRDHVQSVTFSFKENFGTEGRGGYFDKAGIIRDVIQNHLMQVFSLVAMEQPVKVTGEDYSNFVRDAKVQVLNCVAPIRMDDVVTGQYVADDEGKHEGYLDDETVPQGSKTPTFATIVLYVQNRRWEGVPFIFKAGKALDDRKAEVRIQFRDVPGTQLAFNGQECPRNEMVLRLQPDESVYLKCNVKAPGLRNKPIQSELDLTYKERYPSAYNPEAYTRLLLETLRGKQATFVRSDELLASWKLFTPILQKIDSGELEPIPYTYGSRGPQASDDLIARVGYKYNREYDWVDTHQGKHYK